MIVSKIEDGKFQIQPADLTNPANLVQIAQEFGRYGKGVSGGADTDGYMITLPPTAAGLPADGSVLVIGHLSEDGVVETKEQGLRKLLTALAEGVKPIDAEGETSAIVTYGLFRYYADDSYSGPIDYIVAGYEVDVFAAIEAGTHRLFQRLTTEQNLDDRLALLVCMHEDWAAQVGRDVAEQSLRDTNTEATLLASECP